MLLTLLPDMNIAALKYAHVQREHGGPIASVSFRERSLPGGKIFEAFAFLDEKKTGYREAGNVLYGNAHGTGMAATKPEAIYCAISEALERWAWNSAGQDTYLRESLRYDLDPSPNGFAAFPGLGLQGAKKRAYFEAAEQWSLRAWWEGGLTHSPLAAPDAKGIQISTPIPGVSLALIWSESGGSTHYGFGASFSAAAALEKAKTKLQRNRDLPDFYLTERAKGKLPELSLTERRLRFFAEPKGAAAFAERVARQGNRSSAPELIVDLSVRGDWSQYAHVWRCLFDCSAFRETDKDDYFLF